MKPILIDSKNYEKEILKIDRPYIYEVRSKKTKHSRANGKSTNILYIGKSDKDSPGRISKWFKNPNGHSATWTLYWWIEEMRSVIFKKDRRLIGVPKDDNTINAKIWWTKYVSPEIEVRVILTSVCPRMKA